MVLIVIGVLMVAHGRAAVSSRSRTTQVRVHDEVTLAASVASSVRTGSSLRHALAETLERQPGLEQIVRRLEVGIPLGEVAGGLVDALPVTGRQVAAAVAVAGVDGGAVAPLFDRIGARARDTLELDRRRRAAMAQVRLSAFVVGVLPSAFTLGMLLTGRLSGVVAAGGMGLAGVGAGLALQALGLSVMAVLVRRSR